MKRKYFFTICIFLVLTACQGTKAVSTEQPDSTVSTQTSETIEITILPTLESSLTQTPIDIPIQTPIVDPINVPSGIPATLDGTITPGEWDNARIEYFIDGSEMLLQQSEGYLYLAIRALDSAMIAANVFIQHEDEIRIMHSSAALGTAIYSWSGNSWQQAQNFTWTCRSTDFSESAKAEREEFFMKEDWLAANGRMGTPNELEYKIKIPDQDFLIAVVYIKSIPPYEHIPWPAEFEDDSIRQYPDGLPLEMQFSTEIWSILDF